MTQQNTIQFKLSEAGVADAFLTPLMLIMREWKHSVSILSLCLFDKAEFAKKQVNTFPKMSECFMRRLRTISCLYSKHEAGTCSKESQHFATTPSC